MDGCVWIRLCRHPRSPSHCFRFPMSIAVVDRRNDRPELMFGGGSCCVSSAYRHPSHASSQTRDADLDSCTSSSIGMNSDDASPATSLAGGSGGDADLETEVQSSYKDPLHTMDALQEALPLRRGISMFYSGKAKSFTSIEDVSWVSSIRDLAKPRKNMTVSSSYNSWLRSYGGGVSKRRAGLGHKRVAT